MARSPLSDAAVREVSPARRLPARSTATNILLSLRPEQWTKNLIIFAGLIFGQKLFDFEAVARTVAAFLIFCAVSGVVYLINDVADREADGRHPLKSKRPIASGALRPGTAMIAAAGVGAAGLGLAYWSSLWFGVVVSAYLALLAAYSAALKHVVIIDVLTISAGFVLRAVAGAVVIGVSISQWLLVCTTLLALFIALSKRRHELVLLADGAIEHRRILGEYSPYLLDQMIGVVAASTLIAYVFYTISPDKILEFGTDLLGLTIPFPLYGLFRYLYLVHRKEGGGSPSALLLNDRPLLLCVALWAAAVVLIIYRPLGV
jgi:4-hydroxybenzoate polyprenyltransferase